jgi:hypothetical protein
LWQALAEEMTTRDWRDLPIVPPHATLAEQLKYRGEHIASKFKPIGIQQLTQEQKKGSAISLPERIMGFGPAGAYIQNPQRTEKIETDAAQRAWKRKEALDNADRMARGLPPLPPRILPP